MNAPLLPGHPHMAYRGTDLFCEQVRLADLAHAHGTPLYVYSKASMLDALAAYQRGFAGRRIVARGGHQRSVDILAYPGTDLRHAVSKLAKNNKKRI